jgi:acid phosphatase type 7
VSGYITGPGTYSFAIVGESSDAAHFASRETATPPQLLINGGLPGGGGGGGGGALTNETAPVVSQAAPLRTLYHAQPGTWTGSGSITFTYQWERCAPGGSACEAIAGAVGRRYIRTDADLESSLRATVTARDANGTATASSPTSGVIEAPPAAPSGDPIVGVSADIACSPASPAFNGGLGTATECRQAAVSDLLLDSGLTAVLIPGDIQYEKGEYEHFVRSYDVSWGRLNGITYPAPGNHEYGTSGAAGYYDYFGPRAGDRLKGYYSFDIGTWHVIALNSNCAPVGGCGPGSPQEQWLRADLAANPADCTLAYWHHPRFSSGRYGTDASVTAFWTALHDHGADLVLNGHEHHYERFAPQTPTGTLDLEGGIRQIIVGTGGKSLRATQTIAANSEVRNDHTYGALRLTLRPGSYAWDFDAVAGGTFTDAGTGTCVGAQEPTGAPATAFSATPRSGRSPLTVGFTDLSTRRPSAWAWDFDGDGVTDSTVQHPQHVYSAPGHYSVTLTTTNSVGSGTLTRHEHVRVPATVAPADQTDPVPHSGDAADDPAIWVHPTDAAQSLVIGTDKASGGGLITYDLGGTTVQVVADGAMNNVDVRNGFTLAGTPVPLVVATQDSDNTIATYAIDPATRTLSDVQSRPITPGVIGYGACLYHSAVSGQFFAFVTSKSGVVEQWRLFDDGAGKVDAALDRSFDVGGQVEGCVADDENGLVYFGEEDVGIWRYSAEPDGDTTRVAVDSTTGEGRLVPDVEGLALTDGPDGGYLIVSSQGDSSFLVYERGGANAYVGSFSLGSTSTIDVTTGTDGIDAVASSLGTAFGGGLFVAQDTSTPAGRQNFKLVGLDVVLSAVLAD